MMKERLMHLIGCNANVNEGGAARALTGNGKHLRDDYGSARKSLIVADRVDTDVER